MSKLYYKNINQQIYLPTTLMFISTSKKNLLPHSKSCLKLTMAYSSTVLRVDK